MRLTLASDSFFRRLCKCPSCEKYFSSRTQLRSHSKIHETSAAWNETPRSIVSDAAEGTVSAQVQIAMQQQPHTVDSPFTDIAIDPDSTVSEKVLLDTVAEKQVMNRAKVSYPPRPSVIAREIEFF